MPFHKKLFERGLKFAEDVKGGAGEARSILGEFFQPTEDVRIRDVIREAPTAVGSRIRRFLEPKQERQESSIFELGASKLEQVADKERDTSLLLEDKIIKFYQSDLRRNPTQKELEKFQRSVEKGKSLFDIQIEQIASTDEAVGFKQTLAEKKETLRFLRENLERLRKVFKLITGRDLTDNDFASDLEIRIGSLLESGLSEEEVVREIQTPFIINQEQGRDKQPLIVNQ